jgi:hypothetical protein
MTNTTRPRRSTIRPGRRRPRATAVRQALRLCEAELTRLTWEPADPPTGAGHIQSTQRCISPVTTKAALRAAGVPPLAAAALRRRLRLIPEQETER